MSTECGIKALIFDVDGTLAETEELHRRAFNESFEAAGLEWRWDEELYARLLEVTGGKERIAHYIHHYGARPSLEPAAIAALHVDKTARYAEAVQSGGLALRPGVARMISEAASAGVRLAIATTTSRPNVDALLLATLGSDPFEVIAAGDEVPRKKPAPDIYLLALERLQLRASECLAVEDTLNGLRSALDAGLACIVTRSVYGGKGPFPAAAAVVASLDDGGGACGSGPSGAVKLSDLEAWHRSSL